MSGDWGKSGSIYLGIDPGRFKCGLALVRDDGTRILLEVRRAEQLLESVSEILDEHRVDGIALGDGTGHSEMKDALSKTFPEIPLALVNERNSTEEARDLFFADHPPRGIWRIVPRGLLCPGELADAYAALAIVFRHMSAIKKDANDV